MPQTVTLAQVLYWMQTDAGFRQLVFTAPDRALAALTAAGYELADADAERLGRFAAFGDKEARLADLYRLQVVQAGRLAALEAAGLPLPLTTAAGPAALPTSLGDFFRWLRREPALQELLLAEPDSALALLRYHGVALAEADVRRLRRLSREALAERLRLTVQSGGAAAPDLATPSTRVVNTGFARLETAARPLAATDPLPPDRDLFFWLEIGPRLAGSIETGDAPLPPDLPDEAALHVVLFGFAGELALAPDQAVGVITVPATGPGRVTRPAATPAAAADVGQRRLFFPVHTPATPGRYRLRCHIYFRGTLLQSRLVSAQVGVAQAGDPAPALAAEVDFTLSRALHGRQLHALGQTRLSIMLNDNGGGTHGFRYFGAENVRRDVTVAEGTLQTLIDMARAELRRAAWGDEGEFEPGKVYRYEPGQPWDRLQPQLTLDLIRLAQRGARFFTDLILVVAGGDDPWDVADSLRPPGQIQFASRQSARLVLPLALVYDAPFDDGLRLSDYSVCATFLAAVADGQPLAETACFGGNCPHYGHNRVVCPSGFWGFRHQLGLPVSTGAAPDAPVSILATGSAAMAVSVSTDPEFVARAAHERALRALGVGWEYADTRDGTLALLQQTTAQAVYFYCHGGLAKGLPYLSVGPPGGDRIVANNLFNHRIRWRRPRPLVLINGCHTTALSPEAALDLVTAFVGVSHAAGVIGTEISIFEPIAVAFAESFFRRFLQERQSVGEAVRGARLEMLQTGNPLGLVYIPYALPELRLTG